MMKIAIFSRIKEFAANARKKSKGITLGEFIRSYADERRKEGEKIYEGRCGSILSMLKHLETFGGSDIPLKKVDVETVKQFIDYLRSAHDLHKNMKTPGKLSDSTIHLKVNILKSVLREAVRQGLLEQNPFDRLPSSYRIHPHYQAKETLTMEDLITLKQTPCKTPQLKEAVLLSSLTGLRKSDILSLSHDDIIEIDGTPYIYGSPWSGKTPCYRNVKAKLGAITRIDRAQKNYVEKLSPAEAFASILPSCSSMKWDLDIFNNICNTISHLVELSDIYTLHCLPNREAAIVCNQAIRKA